jgi:hypothetical protein
VCCREWLLSKANSIQSAGVTSPRARRLGRIVPFPRAASRRLFAPKPVFPQIADNFSRPPKFAASAE